jgi:hypothetical protein
LNTNKVQTDNSYLDEKIKLRLDNLPDKKKIKVLDCFRGEGLIWETIKKARPGIEFEIIGIDQKKDRQGIYLVGDNLKYLKSMNLSGFDVIDLDAYGVPYKQCEIIFNNPTGRGKVIFATVIQSMFGGLPRAMLNVLGYKTSMIKKIPSLFFNNGIDKFLQWLALCDIKQVKIYSNTGRKKNYLCFKT